MISDPPHPPSRPASLSGSGRPDVEPTGAPEQATAGFHWPPGLVRGAAAASVVSGALACSGAAAHALTHWMPASWAAACGTALGMALVGLPLVWYLRRGAGASASRSDIEQPEPAGRGRVQFLGQAEREFARARRYGTGAALLLVEVDRLARLHEMRGTPAGDAVMAELLRQTAPGLRTADVLTRFSTSQMAVFLAHADATGALDVAERIRERTEHLEIPLLSATAQAARVRVTVSVGVAHLRPAHLHLQAMVDDAQDATAAARAAGGNCVRAAPVDVAPGLPGGWRERRSRPKQGGTS